MAEQSLGANFTIDVTDLKAGLAQANRLIRESETEFKAAAAGMDDWTSSSEGLQARIKNLNTVTDLQRKKVDALNSEYDRLIKNGMDPASKEAVELRTKINQQQAALNKNEKELDQQTKALEEMGDESKQAGKGLDDLSDGAEKSGNGLAGLKKGAGIAAAAIAAVAAAAVAGVAKLLSLAEETRELRNEMARLETGFTTAGLSAEDATETYNTLYSVLGDTGKASEAAGHLALLANNSEDLAKWTDICTGVYAQFGDSLPIEGLTEASNETAKTGQLTGVLADALNWAGVNEEDFQKKLDACSNEQERQALITDTLSGLYDEQSDKFKELNKDVIAAREAEAELAQAQADLGASAEPLNTKLTELKTTILQGLSPALQQIMSDLTDVFDGVEGSPERLANTISETIGQITEQATAFVPKVGEFAAQLVGMLAQVLIEQLPSVIDASIQLMNTIVNTLADMAPSLIMTLVDAVLDAADAIIDNVDAIVDSGIALMMGLVDGIMEALPRLVEKIPEIIDKLVDAIFRNLPKILQAGVTIILELSNGIMDAVPQLLAELPTIIAKIVKGLLTEGIPALIDAGGQLLAGLFEGMLNPSVIWENIQKIGGGIIDGVKSFFGIHSPSKVFEDEIGKFMGQGMAIGLGEGFEDGMGAVGKAIRRTAAAGTGVYATGGQNAYSGSSGGRGSQSVVINQYNTYSSQKGTRYEQFKAKQNAAAAVRLALAGGNAS